MDLFIMFVPFVLALGAAVSNDPLTRRFNEDYTALLREKRRRRRK